MAAEASGHVARRDAALRDDFALADQFDITAFARRTRRRQGREMTREGSKILCRCSRSHHAHDAARPCSPGVCTEALKKIGFSLPGDDWHEGAASLSAIAMATGAVLQRLLEAHRSERWHMRTIRQLAIFPG